MIRIVGIDLGTTNSLCAVFDGKAPVLIPNAIGELSTPSVVGMLEDGRMLTGHPAREMRVTKPARCASQFKREMGTDRRLALAERDFSAPELSSLILESLVQDARAHLGVSVTDAVITVPAYFNDNQRQATVLAGELAGLNVRRIINEPTAAALTYGFHEKDADKKILVFDLGGGTFDVTVMEIFEGTLEIIATAGISQLGGEDFTHAIASWAADRVDMAADARRHGSLRFARLLEISERAKLALGERDSATITVPGEDGRIAEDAPVLGLDRATFAELAEPLLARLRKPLERALRDGGCAPDEIDDVIMVGGATRMPLVRDFLEGFFSRPPLCTHDPDRVVAMGAAIQAALMEDHEAVEELVLTDVCPFTLGVEVSKHLGSMVQDGYYLPIIHRNTTVPVSREEAVATLFENQRQVVVKVYQGESRKTKENLLLGELEITEIPPGPAGQPIFIRFTYDMNGILEVEAVVPESGHSFRTVLTHHVKGLEPREIEEAVARMAEIKFYPRDEVRHQHLLRFAEQVVGEVNPVERHRLEEVVDQFEQALHEGDRELFAHWRGRLIETLDNLGYAFEDPGEG